MVLNAANPLNIYQQQVQQEINGTLSKSHVQEDHQHCYLVNKEILHQQQKLNQINNITYNGQIISNTNFTTFVNTTNLDYAIKIQQISFNNQLYNFPMDFRIINQDHFNTIPLLLNNKTNKQLFEEVYYKPFNDGFIFMSKEEITKLNQNVIYIYSMILNGEEKQIDPIAIIVCKEKNERNQNYNLIIKDQNLNDIIKNPKIFSNKIRSPIYLFQEIIQQKPSETKIVLNKIKNQQNAIIPQNGGIVQYNTMVNQSHRNIDLEKNIKIEISDRLKAMISLATFQLYSNINKLEKVYLINPQWLDSYNFKEIKNLVLEKSGEIIKLQSSSNDKYSIANIIGLFDQNKLYQLNSKMNFNTQIPFNSYSQQISLVDKNIDLYTNFVLANDKIFEKFKKSFAFQQINDNIEYIYSDENKDLIILKNHQIYGLQNPNQLQNIIFIGILDKNNNEYNIEHIFDYNSKNILKNELELMMKYKTVNYIYNKTCLTPKNPKEFFSPIFDNEQIVGNYYQYMKGFDYRNNCINYKNYLNNKLIYKVIYLYNNEISIKNKINSLNNYQDEELYLIKKEIINDIKAENNYEYLKKYLAENVINIQPSNRDLYLLIKNIPPNELNNLNPRYIPKELAKNYDIDISPIINPNNQLENYMAYKDFELFDKNFAKLLFEDSKYPYQQLTCSFLGNNTIAFHYHKNYMYLISKLDENNNCVNKYLIIYKESKYYKDHFQQIKYNLNNYIKSLSFMNNSAPIAINGYIEIGSFIILNSISSGNSIYDLYIPPYDIVISDITKDFPSKPSIGLENIGATCYMNATLQCLSNIKKLIEYFKYNKHLIEKVKADTNKESLSSAFKLLIENIYPYKKSQNYKIYLSKNPNNNYDSPLLENQEKYYAPRNFKDTISRKNSLFQGIAANDAKDLINFLLMTLHEESNRAPQIQVNRGGNVFQDQTNQQLMLNNFFEHFKNNYRSIISDLFYAVNCNITQCANCNVISYNYQLYFFLIFPLEEVRKFKLTNSIGFNNNINAMNNIVDLYDCFLYDQKVTYMMNENAMYCNYCKRTTNSLMKTNLTSGPEVLIIILNRGKGIEFPVKINFYLDLNLANFIERKEAGCFYELFGVITHIGESNMGGHFIAYCKDMWTNKWVKYNDAIVSFVNDFKSEVIDFAMPYVLFYQKK